MTLPELSQLSVGPLRLPEYEGWDESVHDLQASEVLALKTAVAAGRPLLVRGEPGTGKTQLARAAAVSLKRHFVSQTLDAHTEARDLFWSLDAVRRLSEAQLLAATYAHRDERLADGEGPQAGLGQRLAEARFVEPGVLWWAFNWEGAAEQQVFSRGWRQPRQAANWVDTTSSSGAVVLLDEIDKADPVLPNALLEALGAGRFDGPVGCEPIQTVKPEPLVIITTNEERELPYAFMRRCAVLTLSLPQDDADLKALLIKRGQQHGKMTNPPPSEAVLVRCAELLIEDRRRYGEKGLPRPGQAEFLDLLRAVCRLADEEEARLDLLKQLQPFVLKKHGELAEQA